MTFEVEESWKQKNKKIKKNFTVCEIKKSFRIVCSKRKEEKNFKLK